MYRHLSYEERVEIATLRKEGLSAAAIVRRLGRIQSAVSRELRRNKGGCGYRPQQAQGKAGERRRAASSLPRKLTAKLWDLIESKLRLQWSPERIAGWLALQRIARIRFQWTLIFMPEWSPNSCMVRASGAPAYPWMAARWGRKCLKSLRFVVNHAVPLGSV